MQKQRLTADVKFSPPAGKGVLLGERVREAGCDPKRVLAVIPAACMVAGRVDLNGRICPPEDGIYQHEKLLLAAKSRPLVAGEQDHPESDPTWNVITRLVDGWSVPKPDGAVELFARFGILNTTLGRDLMVLWEEGLDVGVSFRGWGKPSDHVLTDESPYLGMNAALKGETVKLISNWELEAYDLVRVPAHDTFAVNAKTGVRAALERIEAALRRDNQEEEPMDLKQFMKDHADIAAAHKAQILAEVVQAKDPVPELMPLIAAAEGRIAAQAAKDRESLEAALKDRDQLLTDGAKKLEAVMAKADRLELKDAVSAELDTFIKGRKAGEKIRQRTLAAVANGSAKTLDDAKTAMADAARDIDEIIALSAAAEVTERKAVPAPEVVTEKTKLTSAADKMRALTQPAPA